MEYLINIIKGKNTTKSLHEKKEEELTLDDRLQLIQESDKSKDNIISTLLEIKINNKEDVDINNRIFNDLEFFVDNNNQDVNTIYSKVNNTITEFGNCYLKSILEKPTYDINILEARQNIQNNYFNLGKENIDKITKSLNIIKELERDISWFWNNKNKNHIEVFNNIIFLNYTGISKIDNYLNKNEILLSINNIYKIFLAPISTILTPMSALIVPIILFVLFRKKLPEQIRNHLNIKRFFGLIINTFTNFFKSNMIKIFIKDEKKAKLIGIIISAVWVFLYLQSIYSTINLSGTINKIINLIHTKMNSINKLISETYKIHSLCNKVKILDYIGLKYDLINTNTNSIKELLNEKALCCPPSLFSNKGKILSKYHCFIQIKNKIVDIMKYVGLIDTLNSNQILINKYNYSNTIYSNEENPQIKCKSIWNPFLTEKPISNNVNIDKNIIITGPNAAGKSTFIKSIAINLILSQTIGLSSSKELELTPFKLIDTYLHIPDIKGTSSLFETEMIRSKEYINRIKKADGKSFVIMDELFSSTNYIEGFSGAYAILNKMSTYDKSLFIVTTHYTKLSNLEKESKGRIKNYKFEVDRDVSNNILFNYKLKKGFSEQFIALELLNNNQFDKDIITKAIEISKTIDIKDKRIKKKLKKKNKKVIKEINK